MKTHHTTFRTFAATLAAAFLAGGPAYSQHFEDKEHHLGPTGLFGVTSPTDIKITKVVKDSPADGAIKVGDVIVAAGGTPFEKDTRRQFAEAIERRNPEPAKGILNAHHQGRAQGRSAASRCSAPIAPPPHSTAPKTDAIITRAADRLVASKEFRRDGLPIGLLGLLATGESKYIDVVRQEIHEAPWAKPDVGAHPRAPPAAPGPMATPTMTALRILSSDRRQVCAPRHQRPMRWRSPAGATRPVSGATAWRIRRPIAGNCTAACLAMR